MQGGWAGEGRVKRHYGEVWDSTGSSNSGRSPNTSDLIMN